MNRLYTPHTHRLCVIIRRELLEKNKKENGAAFKRAIIEIRKQNVYPTLFFLMIQATRAKRYTLSHSQTHSFTHSRTQAHFSGPLMTANAIAFKTASCPLVYPEIGVRILLLPEYLELLKELPHFIPYRLLKHS